VSDHHAGTRGPANLRPHTVTTWSMIVEALDYIGRSRGCVYRGQERDVWTLETSLEHQFEGKNLRTHETETLKHFVRRASSYMPNNFVAGDTHAAAWLGLLQHYGGPTRLLDVSRSPYVALFFAMEPLGNHARALWAIDSAWCQSSCADFMSDGEKLPVDVCLHRLLDQQAQLVYSLVHGEPFPKGFETFRLFRGVFPVAPGKPDARQAAQQAEFLCPADLSVDFMANLETLSSHDRVPDVWKLVVSPGLRLEILQRLELMNITAATLFPDLGGLARSVRTLTQWQGLPHSATAPAWLLPPER
jgi:FRG domain